MGWPRFITVLYYWIISVTIGLMVLHCVADWVRHIRNMQEKPFVIRLTVNETLQHWVLAVSFITLVVSGFSLRFSEAGWAQLLFGWSGGEGFIIRGQIHRVAAVIFMICSAWHFFFLLTRRGRHWFRDMLAGPRDLVHIKEATLFFLGASKKRPRFGRFSYMEKCEYWALIWGSVIMTVTGVALWFDNYFVKQWSLPKGFLDVMLVVHYYEAWLATLAIFVWHGYSTLLSPHVYPMNPAWIAGRMPKDMYVDEHPDGPKLKAFTDRRLYEEEEEQSVEVVPDADAEEPAGEGSASTRGEAGQ